MARASRRIARWLRDSGLTLALLGMFLVSLAGMILAGLAVRNEDLAAHGLPAIGFAAYLTEGPFLSALFENWESEFLQMASYVVLTAVLYQRGSAESRDPDASARDNDAVPWRDRRPVLAWLYEHSLGLALAGLFVASFAFHWRYSVVAANLEAAAHGRALKTMLGYLTDPQFWFESFQNWQSEFLSTAFLVVLSIVLRQRGSPESKPVAARHSDTGA